MMIRLTLILLIGLFGAMAIWGTETAEQKRAAIIETVLNEAPAAEVAGAAPAVEAPQIAMAPVAPVLAVAKPAPAPPPAERPAPVVEVARYVTIPLTVAAAAEPARLLVVTGSRVNLRAGPSTDQAILGSLARGARAELVSDNGEWLQVRDISTGRTGFMAARFLEPARQ